MFQSLLKICLFIPFLGSSYSYVPIHLAFFFLLMFLGFLDFCNSPCQVPICYPRPSLFSLILNNVFQFSAMFRDLSDIMFQYHTIIIAGNVIYYNKIIVPLIIAINTLIVNIVSLIHRHYYFIFCAYAMRQTTNALFGSSYRNFWFQ